MSEIIAALKECPEECREKAYRAIIPAFEDFDCDTLCESLGKDPTYDKVYRELNPEEDEEA